mmetsp:Transcript_20406/g.36555  ORF Transcript_20406/g.36555 Transcript_20406/m.36555 type:complete len:200 (-) Transcript_20406:175-774(-)
MLQLGLPDDCDALDVRALQRPSVASLYSLLPAHLWQKRRAARQVHDWQRCCYKMLGQRWHQALELPNDLGKVWLWLYVATAWLLQVEVHRDWTCFFLGFVSLAAHFSRQRRKSWLAHLHQPLDWPPAARAAQPVLCRYPGPGLSCMRCRCLELHLFEDRCLGKPRCRKESDACVGRRRCQNRVAKTLQAQQRQVDGFLA